MPKLIRDAYGNTAILAGLSGTPEQWWIDLQEKRPIPGAPWFTAYPLTGGEIAVQEGAFEILRDATPADLRGAIGLPGRGFNPARDSLLTMFGLPLDTTDADLP